jgi:hypothetical protein
MSIVNELFLLKTTHFYNTPQKTTLLFCVFSKDKTIVVQLVATSIIVTNTAEISPNRCFCAQKSTYKGAYEIKRPTDCQ